MNIQDTQQLDGAKLAVLNNRFEGKHRLDECQESLDNMPEGLQEGDTGQMLQERIEACESAQSELESMDLDFESEHDADDKEITQEDRDQELQDWLDEKKDEMTELIDACEI